MKLIKVSSVMGLIAFTLTHITPAFSANPTEVIMKVYAVALSTSTDCSDPFLVMSDTNGVEMNMISNPPIGSAMVPNGTYNCVIMKMSDQIRFRSDSDTGNCTAGTQYTIDICRTDGNGSYTPLVIDGASLSYGSATACTGSGTTLSEDQVTLFLSTGSSLQNGEAAFSRPTVATNGIQLGASFVVTGTGAGTFVVNFDNKIDGSNQTCDVQAPVFSFRN